MKKEMFSKYGDLLVRITLGLIFVMAGYGKLSNLSGTSGFFGGLGIPMPGLFAGLVGVLELIGGILLIIGFYSTISASLLAVIILVAILTVHLKGGFNDFKYPLLLLFLLVSYIGKADKMCVLNYFMGKKKKK